MLWSRNCACTHHVDDHTLITFLITWLIIHWSRGYYALITGLHMQCSRNCRQCSRGYHALITCLSCTEHVSDQTLITWLIMHWSRGWSWTNHFVDHALIRGWSYTDHMTDHELITWVRMHWSRGWSCTNHVTDHALIMRLIVHYHEAVHALITCLVIHWSPYW